MTPPWKNIYVKGCHIIKLFAETPNIWWIDHWLFENKNIKTEISGPVKSSSSETQMGQIDVAQLVELEELSYSKTLNSSISLLQKKANTFGNNDRLYQLQEKAFSKEIYGNSEKFGKIWKL